MNFQQICRKIDHTLNEYISELGLQQAIIAESCNIDKIIYLGELY